MAVKIELHPFAPKMKFSAFYAVFKVKTELQKSRINMISSDVVVIAVGLSICTIVLLFTFFFF